MRIAKSVARLLLQRKYAFRAGEQPISRGEPKINKPYDKTKLSGLPRLCAALVNYHAGLHPEAAESLVAASGLHAQKP